jgi:hypothetical protein
MAHFAKLDSDNNVLNIIVVNNVVINDLPFPESEPVGIEFCQFLYGKDTRWLQTSYNGNFRGRLARIGGKYDPDLDIFIWPKEAPYPSWTLNTSTGEWDPPVPMPDDGLVYVWDEDTRSWVW